MVIIMDVHHTECLDFGSRGEGLWLRYGIVMVWYDMGGCGGVLVKTVSFQKGDDPYLIRKP